MGQFYKEHPGAKEQIGKLREFCEQTAGLEYQYVRNVIRLTSKFIRDRGGQIHAGDMGQFYKEHPGAREQIGKLAEFCEQTAGLECKAVGNTIRVSTDVGLALRKFITFGT